MAWLKIESRYAHHPKLMRAGAEALAMDVCAMCYCREFSTGGFVPDDALHALGPRFKDPERVAKRLVDVGRWEHDEALGGWWVHDFLTYNPTVDEVDVAAQERSERGKRAAVARWSKVPKQSTRNARADARAVPEQCDPRMPTSIGADAPEHASADAPHPTPPFTDAQVVLQPLGVVPNGGSGNSFVTAMHKLGGRP